MTASQERDRKEILVTLSVAAILNDVNGKRILLVKNRRTQMWGIPAGGLRWLDKESRLETSKQALRRELLEETGLDLDNGNVWFLRPRLEEVINLPGLDRNRIGIIYVGVVDHNYLQENGVTIQGTDTDEVVEAKFFDADEVSELIDGRMIYKPEFNKGLLRWWQKEQADRFYSGAKNPFDTIDEEVVRQLSENL